MLMHDYFVNYDKFKNKCRWPSNLRVKTFKHPQAFYFDASHVGSPHSKFTQFIKSDFSREEIIDFAQDITNKFDHKLQKHGAAQIDLYVGNGKLGMVLWSTPTHEVNIWTVETGAGDVDYSAMLAAGPRGGGEINQHGKSMDAVQRRHS